MSQLPHGLRQDLLAAVANQPSPTRADVITRRAAWLVLGLVLILGVALLHGIPEPTAARPLTYLFVSAAIALAAAALATRWVLTADASSLGRPRSSLRRLALLLPITLAFGALLANASAPETWNLPGRSWSLHGICIFIYLGLGGALLLIFLFGLKPLDPIAPAVTGAALGAAVGAWTTLAVTLQCPSADPIHALATHVAPGLVLIALGAALGRRVLTFRYLARR